MSRKPWFRKGGVVPHNPYDTNRPSPPRPDIPWDETQRRVTELYSAKTQLLSRANRIERMVRMDILIAIAQLALLVVILLALLTLGGCSTVNERNLQERHSAHLVYAYKTAFNPEWKAQVKGELERRGMNARDFRLLHEGKIGTGMHIDMATGVMPFRRISSGGTFCARGAFRSTCVRVDSDNRIKGWVRL